MKKIDLKNSSFVIDINSSIKDAMAAITDNQRGSVVVVSDDCRLHGIVSDGDIRRVMLGGATTVASIEKITNLNPRLLMDTVDFNSEAKTIFKENIDVNIIPIVNKKNKLIDVIVRNQGKRK